MLKSEHEQSGFKNKWKEAKYDKVKNDTSIKFSH